MASHSRRTVSIVTAAGSSSRAKEVGFQEWWVHARQNYVLPFPFFCAPYLSFFCTVYNFRLFSSAISFFFLFCFFTFPSPFRVSLHLLRFLFHVHFLSLYAFLLLRFLLLMYLPPFSIFCLPLLSIFSISCTPSSCTG
jgi:hypothetical protein